MWPQKLTSSIAVAFAMVLTRASAQSCTPFLAIPSSGTGVTLLSTVSACDDCTQLVTLPFTFMWLGAYPVTQLHVGSNGHINIDKNNQPSTNNACCSAEPIASTSTGLPSGISVAHEDLLPATGGGQILTYYNSNAGSFTISYQNVPFYPGNGVMNAQTVLYADGTVEIRWGNATIVAGDSVASGIIDLSVSPSVILPATVGGFSQTGLINSWTVAGNCQRFEFDCTLFTPITPGAVGSTTLSTVSVCDDCSELVTLPFTFMWLGYYPVTQVYVSSNGNVNIDRNNNPSSSNMCCSATPIDRTSTGLPSGISVAHEDLRPGASASATIITSYNQAQGSFTISYQDVPFFPSTGVMNAQVVLYGDGTVELRWGAAVMGSGDSVASGIIDLSVSPPFVMPALAPGFGPTGVDTTWPGSSRCWSIKPNFAPCSGAYTQLTTGATTLTTVSSCDDCVQAVTLPFTFLWLGRYPVTVINVGSNGHINIAKTGSPSTSSVCCSANDIAITSTTLPSGISVAHEDLNPGSSGNIVTNYSETDGTFTISYQNLHYYGSTTGQMSAQAVLFPDGSVELRWGTTTSDNASSIAAGILDRTTIPPVLMPATALGFNSVGVATVATWYSSPQCQRFPPTCDQFVPITTGTVLTNSSNCDDCTDLVTLPFTFMWLGRYPVTRIKVDSNGNINIDKNNNPMDLATPGYYSATPIINTSTRPWAGISVIHEDLQPEMGGNIITRGTAADGAFIISWQYVRFFGSPALTGVVNAQAVLYPDGGVELRWGAADIDGTRSVTAGILDLTVSPPVVLPATAAGFGANGIDSVWPVAARCQLFTAKTQVLSSIPLASCGTSVDGAIDFGSRVLFGGVSKEIIYKIIVPATGTSIPIMFDTCTAASFDTVLRVYNSDGTSQLAVNDNSGVCSSGAGTRSSVTFTPPAAGGTFLISVESAVDTPTGTFTLTTSCNAAQILSRQLSLMPALTCGNNDTSTTVGGSNLLPNGGSLERIYQFTVLPGSVVSSIQFDTCSASFDTVLRVFTPGNPPTQIAVNDNADNGACRSGSALQSQITFNPPNPGTYYLSVEGAGSATGSFTVSMACTIAQQLTLELSRAPVIACGRSVSDTTVGGSSVLAFGNAPERIYRIDVNSATTMPLLFSTCIGTSYPSLLRVFDSTGTTMLSSNQNSNNTCAGSPSSYLVFDPSSGGSVNPAGTYYVAVEGFGTTTGPFTLMTSCGTNSPTFAPTTSPTSFPTLASMPPTIAPSFPPVTSAPTVNPPTSNSASSSTSSGGNDMGGPILYAIIAAVVVLLIILLVVLLKKKDGGQTSANRPGASAFANPLYAEDVKPKSNPAFEQPDTSDGYLDVNEKAEDLYDDQEDGF